MTIAKLPERQAIHSPITALLTRLLAEAREGRLTNIAVAFAIENQAEVDFHLQPGEELNFASLCRQLDEWIRAEAFEDG